MKHIATLFLSFLLFTNVIAQDQDAISKDAGSYFATLKSKDISASIDYLYPKLFDIAPREKVVEALKATLNDPSIEINFSNMVVSNVSKTVITEDVKYALISYSYVMAIKPLDAMDKKMEKQLLQSYCDLFGKSNVAYDKESKTYTISMTTSMYAINAPGYNSWKFLENKNGMETILQKLIPESVIEQLN